MFLGTIANYTTVANTAIPFTTVINSNDKVINNDGVLSVTRGGYFNIDSALTVTNTTDADVGISVYADGTKRTGSAQSVSIPAGDDVNVAIIDAIKVILQQQQSYATISIVPDTAGAVVNGTLRVEYVC